ncbi:MAG TPA: ATP-binding protein [Puia sp.]|nr:ATP-binding protein [Puia sp.]
MKTLVISILFGFSFLIARAQKNVLVGSIPATKAALAAARTDSDRIRILLELSYIEVQNHPDSAMAIAQQAYDIAQKTNDLRGMEFGLAEMGLGLRYFANYPRALDCELKSLQLAERLNDIKGFATVYGFLGAIYFDQGYWEQALFNSKKAVSYSLLLNDPFWNLVDLNGLGHAFALAGQLDSALFYEEQAIRINKKYRFSFEDVPYTLGIIYEKRGDYKHAIGYYRESGQDPAANLRDFLRSYTAIGRIQLQMKNTDSAIYYAGEVLKDPSNISIPIMLEASNILNEAYERRQNKDSIVKYLKFTSALKDSLFGQEQARQIQNLTYNETLRREEIADEHTRIELLKKRQLLKLWFGGAVALLIVISLFAFYRYRISQLMKLHAVRNDISRDLHDDIGSTLSSINILSEVAEKRMENGQYDLSVSALHKIKAYSYEMVGKMSDIVWAINPKNDSMGSLVFRIKNAMTETCLHENITLIFDVDPRTENEQLPTTAIKNIYLVCKEAIHNAIKHARCKIITVSIQMREEGMRIMITDDGKGFDPTKPGHGDGLANMRSRTEELHGTFAIESSQNHTSIMMYM